MFYSFRYEVFIEPNIALDVQEAIENVGDINHLRHSL